jgi:hypothetical protein
VIDLNKHEKVLPYACIRKGAGETYCRRELNEHLEFVFTDAERAIKHYSNNNVLRACGACIQACLARGVGKKNDGAHFATQGLVNDR